MAKQTKTTTSSNTSFFKTGGREAASHEAMAQDQEDRKPLKNHLHGAKMQGREGQQNFIPGAAPVGQRQGAKPIRTRPIKKK